MGYVPPGEPYALLLRRVPLAEARLMLAGRPTPAMQAHWHPEYPQADSLDALALLTAACAAMAGDRRAATGATAAWWVHQIVVDDVVVGDIGFHGPPDPAGSVEIGYNVVPAWQGRGVATKACAAIVQQAWQDGAVLVTAETEADNVASQTVLARNGFRLGADGIWRLARPVPA
jgi:RimJ/RimL family protein N-acetyltransferase